ncbi:MAG: hypothetical protein IGS03_01690 [Candidatus Sericytochromatia bacterium]|nr:hypothetical protein [Candidatus Sericytochromatia bacterium]
MSFSAFNVGTQAMNLTSNKSPTLRLASKPVAGGSFTPSTLETAFVLRSSLDYQWEKAFNDQYRAKMQNRLNELTKQLQEAYADLLNVSTSQQIGEGAATNLRADVVLDGNDNAQIIEGIAGMTGFEDLGVRPTDQRGMVFGTDNDGNDIWRAPVGYSGNLQDGLNGIVAADDGYFGYGRALAGSRNVEFRSLTDSATAAGNVSGDIFVTMRVEDDPPEPAPVPGFLGFLQGITSLITGGPPPPTYFNQKLEQKTTTFNTGAFWSTVNYLYNFAPREIQYSYAVGYTANSDEAGNDNYLINGELVHLTDVPDSRNQTYPLSGDDAGQRVAWVSTDPTEGYQLERSGTSQDYTTVVNRQKAWLDPESWNAAGLTQSQKNELNLNQDLVATDVGTRLWRNNADVSDGEVQIVDGLIFQSGTYVYEGLFSNTNGVGGNVVGTYLENGIVYQSHARQVTSTSTINTTTTVSAAAGAPNDPPEYIQLTLGSTAGMSAGDTLTIDGQTRVIQSIAGSVVTLSGPVTLLEMASQIPTSVTVTPAEAGPPPNFIEVRLGTIPPSFVPGSTQIRIQDTGPPQPAIDETRTIIAIDANGVATLDAPVNLPVFDPAGGYQGTILRTPPANQAYDVEVQAGGGGAVRLFDTNIQLGSVFKHKVDMGERSTEAGGGLNTDITVDETELVDDVTRVNARGQITSSLFFNHYIVETRTAEFNNDKRTNVDDLTTAVNDIERDGTGKMYVHGGLARSNAVDASKSYDWVPDADPTANNPNDSISRSTGNMTDSFNGEFIQGLHKIHSFNGLNVVSNDSKKANPILGGFEIGKYEGVMRSYEMSRNIVDFEPPSVMEINAANAVPTDWYQSELLATTNAGDPDNGFIWFPLVKDTLYSYDDDEVVGGAAGYGKLNSPRQVIQARNTFHLKPDDLLELENPTNWITDATGRVRPTYTKKAFNVSIDLTGVHYGTGNDQPKIFINGREVLVTPTAPLIGGAYPADIRDVNYTFDMAPYLQEGLNTISIQASDGTFINSAGVNNYREGIRVTTGTGNEPEVDALINAKVITGYDDLAAAKYAPEFVRPGTLKVQSRWQTRMVPLSVENDNASKLARLSSSKETTGSSNKAANNFVEILIGILNQEKYRDIFKLGLLSNLNQLAITSQTSLPNGMSLEGALTLTYDQTKQSISVVQDKLVASN